MRHQERDTRRACGLVLSVLLSCVMIGCGGARIGGKVMRGDIGTVVIVNATDPRLDEPGLGGIDVELSTPVAGRGGRVVLAKGVTDETGSFSLNAGPAKKLPSRLSIRAGGENEYEVRNTIFRPQAGEQVLVLMREPRSP